MMSKGNSNTNHAMPSMLVGGEIVGVKPHEEHDVGAPDSDATHARVEHVVPNLRTAEELGVVSTGFTWVDSPRHSLAFKRIEIEMEPPRKQEGREKIDRVDL